MCKGVSASKNSCCWLAIAFLRANPAVLRDRFIADLTWGPYVHSEILLGRTRELSSKPHHLHDDVRAYAAFDGLSGFSPSKYKHSGPEWTIIKYPLPPGGYEKAYALILTLLSANLPYNHRDLWQCCIRFALPFEKDLDCETPDTWKHRGGVFCSQVSLLILRNLVRAGTVKVPPQCGRDIEHVNSRGCSPNGLFRILTKPTLKKI